MTSSCNIEEELKKIRKKRMNMSNYRNGQNNNSILMNKQQEFLAEKKIER